MKNYVGMDNGVSGGIFIATATNVYTYYSAPPVNKTLNYTKTKAWVNRIDVPKLTNILSVVPKDNSLVLLERPMINPTRWKASVSAIRALEATLIVLESLGLSYLYVDSKEWQRDMLPEGLEGPELKAASLEIGKRLFPNIPFKKDADSALMAEWARRKNL